MTQLPRCGRSFFHIAQVDDPSFCLLPDASGAATQLGLREGELVRVRVHRGGEGVGGTGGGGGEEPFI